MNTKGIWLAVLSVIVMATFIAGGCSSSDDDMSTDKAAAEGAESAFKLEAPFSEERPRKRIDKKYTCHGENISPHLSWTSAPSGTKSFALIAEDIDHHTGVWVHWVLYNIPANSIDLEEGIPTSTNHFPDGMNQGINDEKTPGYSGPCPIPNVIPERDGSGGSSGYKGASFIDGPHRYVFTLYALDGNVDLIPGAKKDELATAMEGHILAQVETVGKFQLPPTIDSIAERDKMRENMKKEATPTPSSN